MVNLVELGIKRFKFKPGDKVRVAMDIPEEDYDSSSASGYFWVREMDKHRGNIYTVMTRQRAGANNLNSYHLKEVKFGWREHWLSHAITLPEDLFEI